MPDPITQTVEQLQRLAVRIASRSINTGFYIRTVFMNDLHVKVSLFDFADRLIVSGTSEDIAKASSIMVDELRVFLIRRAKEMATSAAEQVGAADRAIKILEMGDDDPK